MAFDPGDASGPQPDGHKRPAFLIDGWSGFFRRIVFVVSLLALMVMIFLSMTGLWRNV